MQSSSETSRTNGKLSHADRDLRSAVDNVTDFGKELVHASEEKIKVGVDYAKKYPVHTAIGAGVAGFALGFLVKSLK